MAADEPRQQTLLFAREARHIGVFEQIRAVLVMARMRDIEADLVQARRPSEQPRRQRIIELPGVCDLREQPEGGALDALGLRQIDLVAGLHGAHGALAGVLMVDAPDEVVEQSVAHRPISDLHAFDAEHPEELGEDGEATGEHATSFLIERAEWDLTHIIGTQHRVDHRLEPGWRDRVGRRVELAHRLEDGLDGTRAAGSLLPTQASEGVFDGLELAPRSHPSAREALGGEPAAREMSLAERDASQVGAGQALRLEAFADDEFGAAAADVDHQPSPSGRRRGVCDTRVDQPRFFHARDDLDGMTERSARPIEERLLTMGTAQRVGADHPDAVCVDVAQPLSEPLEASERTRGDIPVEPPFLVHAGAKANHFAKTIHHDQLTVGVAGDDQVETVGAEVNGGEQLWGSGAGGSAGHGWTGWLRYVRRRKRTRNHRSWWRSDCG